MILWDGDLACFIAERDQEKLEVYIDSLDRSALRVDQFGGREF